MAKVTNGTVTKDPDKVLTTLADNTTVDASPKGGVAAVAKGTDSQNAMDQLNNYYRQQAAKEKSDLAYADYLTGGKVSHVLSDKYSPRDSALRGSRRFGAKAAHMNETLPELATPTGNLRGSPQIR